MDTKAIEEEYKKAKKLYNKKEYKKAFEIFKKLSEQGYDPATTEVAIMYDLGQGVLKNLEKAIEYYKKIKNQTKNTKSLIGTSYIELGNLEAGFKYIEEAIKDGKYEDLVYLGATFEYGDEYGIPVDYEKALYYYTEACKKGYKDGCLSMGKILQKQNKSIYDYVKEKNMGFLKTIFIMLFGKRGLK